MCVLLSGELRVDHKRGTRVSMCWGWSRTCLGLGRSRIRCGGSAGGGELGSVRGREGVDGDGHQLRGVWGEALDLERRAF